jgi:tetratricopeptide (TPR) repeat protein
MAHGSDAALHAQLRLYGPTPQHYRNFMQSPSFPTIDHLRVWQRDQEFDLVVRTLADKTDRTLQEEAVWALTLAMQGNREAASFLHSAALQEPDHEDALWLSDIALCCLLTGQLARSRELLERAMELPGASVVEFGRMAAVHLVAGDLENARKYYQEAVLREPGKAEWHNNLAGILVRQQKLDEALENYDIALRIKPDLQQSIDARQRVLMALDRTDEVVEQLQSQLASDEDNFELRMRLARAFFQDNRLQDAVVTLREAMLPVEESPKPASLAELGEEKSKEQETWERQIDMRRLLVGLLAERDRHALVAAVVDEILRLEPMDPPPFIRLKAEALTEMGRHEEAGKILDEAEEEHEDATPLKLARASLYCESERYEEAETILRELLEIYPGDAALKTQLGQTLLWTGKLDEAAELFEQAAEINPMALAQMVNAKRIPEDEKALEQMKRVADNMLLPDPSRITMGFALAEVYDKQKDYDQAFHYLELANRLTDKKLNYDPAGFSKKIDILIETYTEEFFASQEPIRKSDRTPVFVVGMPRSGTTLTEQILCSHPAIFGAGELDIMARLARLMPKVIKNGKGYPACLDGFSPHLREEGARFYLNGLNSYDTEHQYVVDKMPHNFEKLGLISLIFPKARIIHVQRDSRDTALSNYQQNFKMKHGGMGFAFDLEKIALQINDYQRLMAHWREVLPIPMFEFHYEDLVSDQDYWSRKLLEFVGVEWDESVHDFYKTKRAVRTASVSQVRQPIYKTSRQKWRRYEGYLEPLLSKLHGVTCSTPA